MATRGSPGRAFAEATQPRPLSSNLSTKHRIKFVVAYDGSEFRGFAPQGGQRTVHGILTEAVRQVSGEDCEIYGASRTDSGANARGQVIHFDTTVPIPMERWPKVMNQVLPEDVTVLKAREVHPEFHSRFWADKRYYRYRIQTEWRDPERSRYTFFYNSKKLDEKLMNEAAQRLVGVHDFLAFSQLVEPGMNTVRELYELSVKRSRDEVWIDVYGTAFVRGMMRRISGCLWEIGRGARDIGDIDVLLKQRDKRKIDWPTVLPASGLTLMKVFYGRHPYDRRLERQGSDGDDS